MGHRIKPFLKKIARFEADSNTLNVTTIDFNNDQLIVLGNKQGRVSIGCLTLKETKDRMDEIENNNNEKHWVLEGRYQMQFKTALTSAQWNRKQKNLLLLGEMGDSYFGSSVHVVNVDTSSDQQVLRMNRDSVWVAQWAPQTNSLIGVGKSGGAVLLEINHNSLRRMYTGKSDVFSQCFSSDGQWLFNGSRDGKIRSVDLRSSNWNVPDGSHTNVMQHLSSVSCVKQLSDQNVLVSSSIDGVVYRWDKRNVRTPVLKCSSFSEEELKAQKSSSDFHFCLSRFALDASETFVLLAGGYLRQNANRVLMYDINSGNCVTDVFENVSNFNQPILDVCVIKSANVFENVEVCFVADKEEFLFYA